MKLTIVGCGDAFGSGGQLNTCFHVQDDRGAFLIDCGASALIGFNRLGLPVNSVGTILISHLHGDHFAGLVWWMLHAQHVSRRREPLTIIGPAGIAQRFEATAEALFPGSSKVPRSYELSFREINAGTPLALPDMTVSAFEVVHPSGAPSHALRIERDGRVISFSGDTEWTDNLLACAANADLFICECYGFDRSVRYHLNWRTIEANIEPLGCKRVLLTHMNEDMLAKRSEVHHRLVQLAEDGLVIEL